MTAKSFRAWLPAWESTEETADEWICHTAEEAALDLVREKAMYDDLDTSKSVEVHVKEECGRLRIFDVVEVIRYRATERAEVGRD